MSRTRLYASDTERKRAQRARQRQPRTGTVLEGAWLPLTAENTREALLDALGEMLRDGDADGHAATILAAACRRFGCPEQATIVFADRLRARQPKVLSALRGYPDSV
jgi:hypothetical protein